MDRIVKQRDIKLHGRCVCPGVLDPQRRYFIAFEMEVDDIGYKNETALETYTMRPVGEATITNMQGERKPISVKNSKSKNMRFAIQQVWERLYEDKVSFEVYYSRVMDSIMLDLDKYAK